MFKSQVLRLLIEHALMPLPWHNLFLKNYQCISSQQFNKGSRHEIQETKPRTKAVEARNETQQTNAIDH